MEKAADEGQVLGDAALAAPLQVDAEQFGGRAGDVESARFERRPGPCRGGGRVFPRGVCSSPRGNGGTFRRRRTIGRRRAVPFRAGALRGAAVRGGSAVRTPRWECRAFRGRSLLRRAAPRRSLRGIRPRRIRTAGIPSSSRNWDRRGSSRRSVRHHGTGRCIRLRGARR